LLILIWPQSHANVLAVVCFNAESTNISKIHSLQHSSTAISDMKTQKSKRPLSGFTWVRRDIS